MLKCEGRTNEVFVMKTEGWPLVNYSLELLMERRMRGNSHVRCEWGENSEIASKNYLSTKLF